MPQSGSARPAPQWQQEGIADRRESARFDLPGGVSVFDRDTAKLLRARVKNISLGGCYVRTPAPLPESASVHLRFTFGAAVFDIEGKVVCSVTGHGMGIKFAKHLFSRSD